MHPVIVLIETLWNVNFLVLHMFLRPLKVLIETLWNVNFCLNSACVCCLLVLIETLWNVNLNAESDRAEAPAGINRNIVECKFFLRWYLARSSRVLIETLWNVNVE